MLETQPFKTKRKRYSTTACHGARRVVENGFGILVQRFRVLYSRLQVQPGNADTIVLTCLVLHNFFEKWYIAGILGYRHCTCANSIWTGTSCRHSRQRWRLWSSTQISTIFYTKWSSAMARIDGFEREELHLNMRRIILKKLKCSFFL
jgi:hypothetical protein